MKKYYYFCQVREIMYVLDHRMTEEEGELQHESLEITEEQYLDALKTGKINIPMPSMDQIMEHFTDGYLDYLAAGAPEPSDIVH